MLTHPPIVPVQDGCAQVIDRPIVRLLRVLVLRCSCVRSRAPCNRHARDAKCCFAPANGPPSARPVQPPLDNDGFFPDASRVRRVNLRPPCPLRRPHPAAGGTRASSRTKCRRNSRRACCPGHRVVVPFGTGRKMYSVPWCGRLHAEAALASLSAQRAFSVLDDHALIATEDRWNCGSASASITCAAGRGDARRACPEHWCSAAKHGWCGASRRPARTGPGNAKHDILIDALEQRQELNLGDAGKLLGLKRPHARDQADARARHPAASPRRSVSSFTPRMDRFVKLDARSVQRKQALHAWFDKLENAHRSSWRC